MTLTATIEGIGFWTGGLPSWADAVAFARDGTRPTHAPARPSPELLPPNERRRAPDTVAVALDVALAACAMAARDAKTLSSVFASMHGDLSITDYMCSTLATQPSAISPTRFHNSVHNAAAGYWTIGSGAMAPATAISAFDATFAQGLLEAMAQLATGTEAVLLVGYDSASAGALTQVSASRGLLGGALVLSKATAVGRPSMIVSLADGVVEPSTGALAMLAAGNAMSPMLPLFDALATGGASCTLKAGPSRVLRVDIGHG